MKIFYNLTSVTPLRKKSFRFFGMALVAGLLLLVPKFSFACGCDGNLLYNGGFENGTSGWSRSSGSVTFSYSTTYAMCGNYYAYLRGKSWGPYVYRRVNNITPNAEYELSFYSGVHNNNYWQYVEIIFADANNNVIDNARRHVNYEVGGGTNLAFYSISAIAPANTDRIYVKIYANGDYIKVDELCLTETTGGAVLPAELKAFNARPTSANQVDLNWQTISELENTGFEIQRSYDALDWKALAFVEGRGTGSTPENYKYLDTDPIFNDVVYYRLKQMDADGAYKYTQVVNVILEKDPLPSLDIYPNPVGDNMNIVSGQGTITIINPLGRMLKQQRIQDGTTNLDVSDLAQGYYFLQVILEDGNRLTKKFIKRP